MIDIKKVSLKKARIIQTSFVLFVCAFIMSFIPKENWFLLGINLILATLGSLSFFVLWIKHRTNSKRYFSLLSYVMLNTLSFYASIPILRMLYGTIFFWITLVLLLAFIVLPYFFAKTLTIAINTEGKPGIKKAFTILTVFIVSFGTAVYSNTRYSSNPNFLIGSIFLFLVASLFLLVSPIMLITPKRMDALKKAASEG